MSKKIVTFGEIMLRLATPGFLRFSQATEFSATFGGGEANVAVSLANYGLTVDFVTRLPKNEVEVTDSGQAAQMIKLMDVLDDLDDIQNVYANFNIPDAIMEKLS